MPYEMKLPDVGEGVAEGEILKWFVKEGDEVKENQPLVEVMTDKVNVEIPSPKAGKILRLHAKQGEVIKVGSVLLTIGEKGEQIPTTPAEMKPTAPMIPPTRPSPAPVLKPSRPAPTEILATPATRKLARDLSVDLTLVTGTGPGARITDDDVRKFADMKMKPAAAPTAQVTIEVSGQEERIPLRGVRRLIAEKMTKSHERIPHVTHVEEIDLTELVELRQKAKNKAEQRGLKLTYLPFIIKALIPALKKFPVLNSSLDEERGEIVVKKYYNIGIATATEQGLIVPVVKDCERKTIFQLAQEIETLAEKARRGQLSLDDVQGGTFTITNVGPYGGVFATPIINYPEVAVLGVHRITKRPVVHENSVVIRDVMFVSLSFDHRVLDGAVAAEFTNALKQYLEDPKLLLFEIHENV